MCGPPIAAGGRSLPRAGPVPVRRTPTRAGRPAAGRRPGGPPPEPERRARSSPTPRGSADVATNDLVAAFWRTYADPPFRGLADLLVLGHGETRRRPVRLPVLIYPVRVIRSRLA